MKLERGRGAGLVVHVMISLIGCVNAVFAGDTLPTLTLRIEGLRSDHGVVRVEMYDSEQGYNGRAPCLALSCGITNGVAETRVAVPKTSAVAVRAFHDENGNGELDRTPIGVPEEPIGFSNKARSRFGPPSFRDVAIPTDTVPPLLSIRLERALATDWQIGIGAAVVMRESPYVGGGHQAWAFPNITYVGRRFAILGPRASYLVGGGDHWKLNVVGQVRFNALDPDESRELQGMEQRDITWEMGARLTLSGPRKIELSLGALTDVLGRHGGQEFVVDVAHSFRWASWRLTPGMNMTVLSDKLSEYYYGVSGKEERLPERPSYSPGAAWSVGPSLRVFCERWYPWVFTASAGLDYLGDRISDSPIVEDRVVLSGFLGFSRQFGPGARKR